MTRPLIAVMAALAAASPAMAEPAGSTAMRRVEDAGLRYSVPASWQRVPAPSDMRAAQYRIDGPTPEPADDAEVVLFFFGPGQGGTTEANLDRWYAQFTQPDGKPSREAAVVTVRTVNGLKVTSVDLSGTYTAAAMKPSAAAGPKPDTRMLAAAIEGPGGPWFLRIVGPTAVVGTVAGDFNATLLSLEAHK
jgi:hypothetical protein